MRAVVMNEFGPPEVLRETEAPDPVPAPEQVLVDVEIANVTFVETQLRAGRPPSPAMLPALPAILGNGVGGVVAGRRVVSSLNGTGGYATRAVADAARLIEVPPGVGLDDAVALLADGRTALSLVDLAGIVPGDVVVVEAAAGGVGTLLVQLAHNAGARVVALASGSKLDVVRELGADVAVDYRQPDWARQVGEADVVFDGVGGETGLAAFGLLRAGGRFCPFGMASGTFTPVDPERAGARGVELRRGGPPTSEQQTALTRRALAEAAAGRLRPVIGQRYPLAQAAAAHAGIESRSTVGKTLLLA